MYRDIGAGARNHIEIGPELQDFDSVFLFRKSKIRVRKQADGGNQGNAKTSHFRIHR
jgi:hypothetical protein